MRASLIMVAAPDSLRHKQRNFFDSILAQSHPHDDFELILVDGEDGPATTAAMAAFRAHHPAVAASLVHCPSRARAAANNLAASRAAGEILIFLADDFDPAPGLVAAHVAYHALNPDPDAVGIGPGLFPEELRQDFFARWAEDSGHIFGVPMRRVMAVWPRDYFYAGNASIRREKFDALGGFDERFPHDAWDDHEFGLRWAASGGYSQFLAAATATHRHAVSFAERCTAMEHAGESARVLEQIHPDLEHGWRAMLRGGPQVLRTVPATDAPEHAWIAYFSEHLNAAFRRGYLGRASPLA
ncbi:MAG: glycosyltransferase [Betaproteobacteria bacterium]|nr:glycosyltransferase [Betaproteobacteria bacterium]